MRILQMLLAIALVGGLCGGCRQALPREAPPSVLGVWRTSHPRYEGRYFEIRTTALVIGTGAGEAEEHALRGVACDATGDGLHCTLYYDDTDGAESALAFVYDGDIRLANQEGIAWTRTEASHEASTTN